MRERVTRMEAAVAIGMKMLEQKREEATAVLLIMMMMTMRMRIEDGGEREGRREVCSQLSRWAPSKVKEEGVFVSTFFNQNGGPLCTSLHCHLESCKEKPGRRSQEGVGGGGWREGVWARGEPFQDT